MILLDSDVMIDLLRRFQPAVEWLDGLPDDEEIILPGFVAMELILGCKNKAEQEKLQRELADCGIFWPSAADCDAALDDFMQYRLSHNAGLLDVLIGRTAVGLGMPLHTFNQKHYHFILGLQTVQPYKVYQQFMNSVRIARSYSYRSATIGSTFAARRAGM